MRKESSFHQPHGYANISLPSELVQEIDRLIGRSHMGYKNRAELVKEAIRNHLRRLALEEKMKR
ncbi:ribbon-helix-helix protein, CopG family [Candidatus Woesearchaeota archaeon]|nr:ribbon-helix-helix protein, CopG family [Candidatus Woesearchaeota archaeon]